MLPAGFHRIRYYGLLASGKRANNIARARELLAMPMLPIDAIKAASTDANEPQDTKASLPLLRRPHDHHRDLPARLLAALPPDGTRARNQDRHLMIPSCPSQPDASVPLLLRWLLDQLRRRLHQPGTFAATHTPIPLLD